MRSSRLRSNAGHAGPDAGRVLGGGAAPGDHLIGSDDQQAPVQQIANLISSQHEQFHIEPCRAAGALTLESWTGDELPSQRLLFPERVELTDVEMSRIEVHRDELDELGIECASVGPRSIAIHSVPRLPTVLVCEPRAEDLLRAALLAFENGVDARAAMASAATVRVSDECAADVIAILTQWPPAKRADFIAAWSGVDLRARLP